MCQLRTSKALPPNTEICGVKFPRSTCSNSSLLLGKGSIAVDTDYLKETPHCRHTPVQSSIPIRPQVQWLITG